MIDNTLSFPDQLKSIRADLGKSVKEITDLLEVPRRTWEDWEAGKRTPPRYVEKLIVEKLNSLQ